MAERHSGSDPSASAPPANRRAESAAPAPIRASASPPAPPPPLLRDHLPGLEPDRHVDDWGRSEIVEDILDRGLVGFLYHYWFRVGAEGLENVPAEGPALLVANRAGALRADAAMVAKAIRERPRRPRRVHFATERQLGAVPGLDMLITKAGGVSAHPANLHRLLFDEDQLVLAFPEGAAAGPLRDRYRVRAFSRADMLGAALRARAPIVPVAILGTEEASPIIARLPRPLRGALPVPVPLPAKLRIRFLPPVDADRLAARAREASADPRQKPPRDPVAALAAGVRALIQDALLEMVSARRSVWLG
jgi:1-acyl-sn-glycerol-3-phosphate acyltransferase